MGNQSLVYIDAYIFIYFYPYSPLSLVVLYFLQNKTSKQQQQQKTPKLAVSLEYELINDSGGS